MTAIVLRGLAARKLRTALTALAIVLGAAMVTGTLVMGHTVRSGFHEWYTKANGNSAAVITGHLTVRDNNSDVGTATPPLPASLVAKVRNVPGVAHAEGLVQGEGILIDRSGNEIGGNGPPALVSSVLPRPRAHPASARLRAHADRRARDRGRHVVGDAGEDGDRWDDQARHRAADPHVQGRRADPVRPPRHRRGDVLDRHREDGARDPRAHRPGRPHPDRGRQGRQPVQARREPEGRRAPGSRQARHPDRRGGREGERGPRRRVPERLRVHPARVRRGRPARRRLRHLQHVLDHRRPAHPRARAAAHARRRAPSGALERRPRGGRSSASPRRRSAWRPASASLPACSRCSRPSAPRCPRSGSWSTRAPSFPGSCSGSWSRSSPASCRPIRATRISPTTALREGAGAERKPGKGSLIASFVLLGIAAAALGYGVLGNPSSANTRLLLIAIGSLALILGTAASASRLVGPIVHDRRSAAAALRRPARHARERERAPEPRPHRHHLGGAHDRRRGGRLHRDHRPCRHECEQRRADEARHRRVRRAGERGGRAARQCARRAREGCPGRLDRHGHLARGDQGQRRTGPPGLRRRSLDAALGLQVHVEARLGRARLASSARTTR